MERRCLSLHNCSGLKKANLVSSSIERLSLANCRGLKNLVLNCPSLQVLQVCAPLPFFALLIYAWVYPMGLFITSSTWSCKDLCGALYCGN